MTERDYRNILAIAARYPDRMTLPDRIALAVIDYCDDPSLTDIDLLMIAHNTLIFFNSIEV